MTAALADITAEHARSLTDRIKVAVEGTWHLITEAYTSRAWSALGYTSWDDYCTREFGTSRLRLPREDRSEVVASLRESGLSNRAIAAATGYSEPTIRREVAPASNDAPALHSLEDVAAEFGVDLDELDDEDDEPALTQEECEALDAGIELTDAEQAAAAEQIEVEAKPRITGIDGKSYPKPEPKKPQRRPLTDTARDAGWELNKAIEKVGRIITDDRYPRNKEEVAAHLRNHLLQAVESCQGFLDQLPDA